MAILAALFPPDHPYHWATIGEVADLNAVRLDEVHAFFARYYHPANASIALAGDIDPAHALALVRDYFEEIPAGGKIEPVRAAASLDRDVRLRLEDRVELPRLYLAWHSPALFAEGDADLDLAADVLGGAKASRLYRRLVVERRIATEVTAIQSSRELTSMFQVVATAAPGASLDQLHAAISDEVAALADAGVNEDELTRARAQAEAHFVYRLQTVGGFSGKSDQLNAYNTYRHDPGFIGRDLARYVEATADGVRRAAARWLTRPAVALGVVPVGRQALGLSDASPAVVV
jgi:zinc protease